MLQRKQEIKDSIYQISKNGNLFEVYDANGIPILFYKINHNYDHGRYCFEIRSNIIFQFTEDALISYCITRLYADPSSFIKLEYYLHLITKRIVTNSIGQGMFLDSYFIDANGQIDYNALKVFHQIKSDMLDNFENYFEFDKAYTKDTSVLMHEFLNDPVIKAYFLSASKEINKFHFECMIPNQNIGIEYINKNCSSAVYYEMTDKDNPDDKEWAYYMIIEGEVVLFFGIKEKPD